MYLVRRVEGGLSVRTETLTEAETLMIAERSSSTVEASSSFSGPSRTDMAEETITADIARRRMAVIAKNLLRTLDNASYSEDKTDRLLQLTESLANIDTEAIAMQTRPTNARFRKQ